MRIFNFFDNEEKGRRNTDVFQLLLTQLAGKFDKKRVSLRYINQAIKLNASPWSGEEAWFLPKDRGIFCQNAPLSKTVV